MKFLKLLIGRCSAGEAIANARKGAKKLLLSFIISVIVVPFVFVVIIATAVAAPVLYVDWLAGEVTEWWGDLFSNADELSDQWYKTIYPTFAPFANSNSAIWLGESVSLYYYLAYEENICDAEFTMADFMMHMNLTGVIDVSVIDNIIDDIEDIKDIEISDDDRSRIISMARSFKERGNDFEDVTVPEPGEANDVVMKAMLWTINVANDPEHGYSQINRNGNPDYDCSSLMSYAFIQAGIPVTVSSTHTMLKNFTDVGFLAIPFSRAALKPGDVLLVNRGAQHTEMYIGNNQLVGAHIDESGGITGRIPGDQTGNEISVGGYYDDGWEWILRYGRS